MQCALHLPLIGDAGTNDNHDTAGKPGKRRRFTVPQHGRQIQDDDREPSL